MKRTLFSLAAVLMLAGPVAALAQEQYAQSQPSSQPTQQQNQNMNNPSTPSTTDQNQTNTTTTTDQSSTSTTDTNTMPKTASPLPLVGTSGLSLLATGLWLTRRRKA